MSAFLSHPHTIGRVAAYLQYLDPESIPAILGVDHDEDLARIRREAASLLATTQLSAVKERYPGGGHLPGLEGEEGEEEWIERCCQEAEPDWPSASYPPERMAGALASYEYQTCSIENWSECAARALTSRLWELIARRIAVGWDLGSEVDR